MPCSLICLTNPYKTITSFSTFLSFPYLASGARATITNIKTFIIYCCNNTPISHHHLHYMKMDWPLTLIILLLTLPSTIAKTHKEEAQDLVHSSCIHANYPDLCIRTLGSYSGPAKTPRDLAKAAVKVSLDRARKASDFLQQLKSQNKQERGALRDCVEQIGDSMESLKKTLSELKHLRSGSFRWQMNNAETWVSAALTYEDTCLDGFKVVSGKVRSDVKSKITNVARVTSNALYLITLLDESRGKYASP